VLRALDEIYDGKLTEVPLPDTRRIPYVNSVTGVLFRTDRPDGTGLFPGGAPA
jgi:hypothetical protein